MFQLALRLFGKRVAHKAIERQQRSGGLLDIRFGLSLLRDRRVPLSSKFLAVGLACALVAGLVALELPLESALTVLVPPLFFADMAVDGLESVVGPLVFCALFLPWVAPKPLVALLRNEKYGLAEGPVVAVEKPVQRTVAPHIP